MIADNWTVYVFVAIFTIAIQWAVTKVRGEPFRLMSALSLAGYACIGLTIYYVILAW